MKILIACEESQAVCKAFREIGFEAYSCDIQECSGGHPEWHIKGDCIEEMYSGKYQAAICHPPCTYLANAGLHYLRSKPERVQQLKSAFEFVLKIWNAPIDFIAIENPIGWLNTNWMKPSQIVQPYYFGDRELKTTCLWLKNLPNLTWAEQDNLFQKATMVQRPEPNGFVIRKSGKNAGKRYNYYWRQGKSAKKRSKTFPGIAKAMAEQWGPIFKEATKAAA